MKLPSALLWMALLMFGWGFPAPARGEGVRIAVLKSQAGDPYQDMLAGFREGLERQGLSVEWAVYELNGNPARGDEALRQIRKGAPCALILSLGSLATERALSGLSGLPLISGLVLRQELLRGAPNATGVMLEFPLETQLDWLRRMLPAISTVGVMYSPAENRERVQQAEALAKRLGLNLEAVKVETPQDLPTALEQVSRKSGAIWGISDDLVLNAKTARQILLYCFRNHIPFIGLSSSWTRAGALYSLDRDYRDMGDQCAQQALKILRGVPPARIPVESPRKVLTSVNLKTMHYLNLRIPDALLKGAQTVFQEKSDE
jgi:putative tryptophan/tyrosine transport system substrate-binding protein